MVKNGAVDVERVFIGGGCNRVVNNVSWGACGLISFGSQNAVSIFCPQTAKILTTLPGHKASVNCTHWLPSSKFAFKAAAWEKHYLLSGDAEGVIILWELSLAENKWRYVSQLLQSHKKGITCITAIVVSQTEAIFASTSSDCVVNVWKTALPAFGGDCTITCLDSLSVSLKPLVTLSLAELPGSTTHLILAMGGLDNKIHLYCGEKTGQFVRACELKGHTDWIRSLDFSLPVDGETYSLLLVSSSQDRGIHIWRMALCDSVGNFDKKKAENSLAYYIKGPVFLAGSFSYQVSLESLLIGHEDWVYSVEWQPSSLVDNSSYQPQSILSASMDKTMMIWQPERTTVTDIAWGRSGEYLMSVSHDQTTRIFASWLNEANSNGDETWHEIARPQVHGHDINCLAIIQGKGNHRVVSGAEEKVARVFEAPLSFLKTLNHATSQLHDPSDDLQVDVQVLGANMSALGLSQKPIYVQASSETTDRSGSEGFDTLETIPDAVPSVLTEPPIEEQLAWHTLWPESHKLYGHGNELFSLCCDHGGKLVASSCKAQSASVAEIWLWEVGTWKAVGRLQSHSLTVTQMEFSHDDKYLLAVSRDRQLSLFSIDRTDGTDQISYQLLTRQEAHKRIVWACSWNPFGYQFATGSRDKTVKIWGVQNDQSVQQLATLPTFKSSVTALSWIGLQQQNNDGVVAIGMENGLIELWSISLRKSDHDSSFLVSIASLVIQLDPFMCHVSSVNRLAWRNLEKNDDSDGMQLASCGADHCVRIFKVRLV
ncbi:elongator complex protein 2 isoform X2 [Cynara cardunculus var. scolymus]|uniref:elongator complex protein 2 isoform X2 n=1 Tax=Cynara cardunculus var. scolymus TaxID=59895 RepID=UPI000D628C40|nr:elongator complex protein 2 isoform X2 [Cynara cardunculus var. scolymus]